MENSNRSILYKTGQLFPYEYLDHLSDHLYGTLYQWMKNQNVPDEFIQALDTSIVLKQYAYWKETDKLDDTIVDDIPVTVAYAINFIKMFGGDYYDGTTMTDFEPAISLKN